MVGYLRLAGIALVLGAGAYLGNLVGESRGYAKGFAAADRQAELNDAARKADEARRDAVAAKETAADAMQAREAADAALATATADLETYRAALAKRASARHPHTDGCGLTDDDLGVLARNPWGKGDAGRAGAPAGRR